MRHLVLISALLFCGSASAADPVPATPPPTGMLSPNAKNSVTGESCQNPNVVPARSDGPARASKLGELPPANLVLAVLREEDGCSRPVIVRYGIGADATPEPREQPPAEPHRPQRL